MVESLEDRRLLNVDWRNPVDSIDVDSDGSVSPLDALVVINHINAGGSGPLPSLHDSTKPFLDVDGDQSVSPLDVLSVINHLNANGGGARSLAESNGQFVRESSVTITLGQTSGTRDYRVRIDSQFDTTDHSAALEDLLAVYLVDPLKPTTTLLDRGTNGTALFTLAGTKAEFIPGRVSWDGSVLDINLSDLALSDTGLLKFQLLNSDSDGRTKVTIQPLTNQNDIEGTNGPKLSLDGSPVAAGASTTLANRTPMANGQLQVGNVRYDSSTGKYNAELRLRNDGDSIGREVAVVFPGLPAGVSLRSPSGTTTTGEPYINLKPAIGRGGLTHGSWSEPVAVEFNNPGQVLFELKPKILATINHAPTLAAIAPLTVMPGGVLRVPLVTTDLDGDNVTFNLLHTDGLPTSTLRADSTLEFRPSPSQLGHFSFDVVASDGALTATRTVTLDVVADPLTSTRVSGQVLKIDGQPLANMQVEIGSVHGLTQNDGSFTLDLGSGAVVSDTIKIRGELFVGLLSYPFIAEKLPLLLDHDVMAHANNVIDRPIFLPNLDLANAKQIDPAHDTVVTTAAIPGVTVTVAAGTLMNQQGTPFTGKLSITEVPANLTPAALPNGQRPSLVVTIQPGDMVFTRPTPLILPNRGGYPSGMSMDLWSINPVTGAFDVVGSGVVSADGTLINTVSGGIRNSSWHDFIPTPLALAPNDNRNEDKGCPSCKHSSGLTSEVELGTGTVIEQHPLASYESNGSAHGLTLTYDSERADPRPIIHFGIPSIPDGRGVPIPAGGDKVRFAARLSVQNGSFVYQVPGYTGTLPGLAKGDHFWTYSKVDSVDAALQADLRSFPSGIYQYTINAGFLQKDVIGYSGNLLTGRSQVISVNTMDSPFGAGWGIAGLQSISVADRGDVLLIDGDGSQLQFKLVGGVYQSPAGDFTKLERIDGVFRRTTTDRTEYQFNIDNQLATITDRNGNVTTYKYTLQRLVGIVDSVGLTTVFGYAGSRVGTITDPAGRTTQLVYDAQGNLTGITDPDGAKQAYGYDSEHHKVSETDPLGRQDQTSYGFHGRAISGVRFDGSKILVQPLQTEDLYPEEQTSNPVGAPAVHARTANVSYVDGNGNETVTTLDKSGQLVNQVDKLGLLPTTIFDANNLPIALINARRIPTYMTYDARGNLSSQRDSLSGGGDIFGEITVAGQVKQYSLAGRTGQRLNLSIPASTTSVVDLQIDIAEASGFTYSYNTSSNSPYTALSLPRDGTYSLSVSITPNGSRPVTGDYSFQIIDLDGAPDLQFGIDISGTRDTPRYFSVHATAGQTLTMTGLPGDFSSVSNAWQLLDELSLPLEKVTLAGSQWFQIPATGDYTLVLSRSSVDNKYQFRATLVDPESVPKIGLDTDYTGTLEGSPTISFTAPAGTPVLLNYFGNVPDIQLFDSQSRRIVTYFDPFVVPRSDTYTLYLSGSGPYKLRLIDLSAAPVVQVGSSVPSLLDARYRIMAYRFQGKAGQQIDFGAYYGNDNVGKELRYENDRVYLYANGGIATLPRTGEYTVWIQSNLIAPTTYRLPLIDVSIATHVTLDAPITGQLTPGSGPRYLSVTAQKGDRFYLADLGSSTSVRVRNYALNADGNRQFLDISETGTLVQGSGKIATISVTGTYLIVLDANDADRPATYNFRLVSAKTTEIPVTLGQLAQTTFTERLQTAAFTFQGTTGQKLYIKLIDRVPGTAIALRDPNGNLAMNETFINSGQFLVVLPQSGAYRLEFDNTRDHQLGNTSFVLSDVSTAARLSSGSPLSGSVGSENRADLYRFFAVAGQRITIEQISGQARTFVFFPDGESEFYSDHVLTVPVTRSGEYVILVSNYSLLTNEPYEYKFNIFSDAAVTPSGIDHVYTGISDGTYQTVGTFTANAGTLIFVDGRQGSFFSAYFTDQAETTYDGGVFGGNHIVALPRSGTYVVKVKNSGAFSFRIRLADDAPLIALDTNIAGFIDTENTTDLYRLNVAPGQLLQFDRTDGNLDEITFDYSLQTGNIGNFESTYSEMAAGSFPKSLRLPGMYYVQVSRRTVGAYSFQLHDFGAAPPINLDETVTGTATPPTQATIRRFAGVAGQEIYYNATGGKWSFFGPNDVPLYFAHYYLATNAPLLSAAILPVTGIYTIERDDNSATAVANFSLTIVPIDNPVRVIDPLFSPTAATVYTYDPTFSQLTSVTDELKHTTLYDVDPANGNVRSTTQVVGVVGGTDDLITLLTYLPSGLVDTVTDPLGRVTDYDYDPLGRLTTLTSAKGTSLQTTRRFEPDVAGNVTAQVDENGHRTEFSYDAMGRLSQVTASDPDGVGPLSSPIIKLTYDAAGNRIATTDPLGHQSTTSYDALDRVHSQTDPDNTTTSYAYDQAGNLIRITDPLGHVTEYRYDARNRRTASIDPAGLLTTYRYDRDANLISVTDADGNKTSFEYDARNRLTRQIAPLGKATLYTYDAANNLRTKTDRLGRTTELTYDELDRLVREVWRKADKTIANTIVNSFDRVSQLLHSQDNFSSVSYVWDALGKPIRINTDGPNGIPTTSLAYTFDSAGNELSVVDTIQGQLGGTNAYSYDGLDRTKRIDQSGVGTASKRVDLQYNSLGQMTSLARYSDVLAQAAVANSTYTYDTLSRLSGISHKNSANSVLDSFAYQYDAASRITQIADIDGVTNYAYDTRDELIAATHPASSNLNETYAYDPTGNRISSSRHGSGYTVGDGPAGAADANRLTSDGTYRYSYDDEGNLNARTQIAGGVVREFTWDHRNRLTRVTDRPSAVGAPTQVVDYTYDTLNRRIASKVDATPGDAVDGKITYFVYDGSDVLVELVDLDGSGPAVATESMRYLHGPAVDQILAQEDATGKVLWDLADHLETVRDLVNNSGIVVNHLKYDSFGNVFAQSNPAANTRYQFTGREHDSETGLQYNRARYYDATSGRFLSEDPIGFNGRDFNVYRYVANSPTTETDPSGLNGLSRLWTKAKKFVVDVLLYIPRAIKDYYDSIGYDAAQQKIDEMGRLAIKPTFKAERKISYLRQLDIDIGTLRLERDVLRAELDMLQNVDSLGFVLQRKRHRSCRR